jgi:hypothetical protein
VNLYPNPTAPLFPLYPKSPGEPVVAKPHLRCARKRRQCVWMTSVADSFFCRYRSARTCHNPTKRRQAEESQHLGSYPTLVGGEPLGWFMARTRLAAKRLRACDWIRVAARFLRSALTCVGPFGTIALGSCREAQMNHQLRHKRWY